MLKADAEILKRYVKEKRFDELEGGVGINKSLDVRKALIDVFPQLFQTTGMRVNPDGTTTEQTFRDYKRWSITEVIEKIKANHRKLDF